VRARLALAATATIAAADWVIHRHPPRWILTGLWDEPAHLATGALVALNLPGRPRAWRAGLLAGSLLPDVDHVPLALAERHPSMDDPRPPTHSLFAVLPLFTLARATGSEAVAGVAWGSLVHFARDLAMGNGAPLLAPLHRGDLRMPYPLYAAAVAGLTVVATINDGL